MTDREWQDYQTRKRRRILRFEKAWSVPLLNRLREAFNYMLTEKEAASLEAFLLMLPTLTGMGVSDMREQDAKIEAFMDALVRR